MEAIKEGEVLELSGVIPADLVIIEASVYTSFSGKLGKKISRLTFRKAFSISFFLIIF